MLRGLRTVALLLLCALTFPGFLSPKSFEVDTAVVNGELGSRLDEYLTRITPFGFAGAVLVASDGEIVLNKGYGMADRSRDIGNTAETVFSTGSITKQFTAAAIMKLEMQDKLNTYDLVSEYLDAVPDDKAGITLHHLLTHTAGVTEQTGHDYEMDFRDETVKSVLDAPLHHAPGDKFLYSNSGYTLLAAVVEKVSGQPYEVFLRENLFKPAGMDYTGYRLPNWDRKVLAHWYRGDIDSGTPLEKLYPFWNLIGNGGILSTTEDMYRWHLALGGDEVLSAGAKTKLFTPALKNYAYGWDVLETEHGTLIAHDGGSSLGNSAEFIRYVDAGVTIVIFANQSYGRFPLSVMVKDKIEKIAFGEKVTLPTTGLAHGVAARGLEGIYELASGGTLVASVENGVLVLAAQGQDAINLIASPDTDELDHYRELKTRTESIFRAALGGDYGPLAEVLNKADDQLYPVRRFLDMVVLRAGEITGDIGRVEALGSLRSSVARNATRTMLKLQGDRGGSIYLSVLWLKGKIDGMRLAASGVSVSVPFLPVSETDFAGYHLGIAKNVRATFEVTDEGLVVGQTVDSVGGAVDARKQEHTSVAGCGE